MTKRAKAGQNGSKQTAAEEPVRMPQPQSPLDYALRIMRDENQPAALRASMAKAAMPYLHKRAEENEAPPEAKPEERQWSDLELARRIAHILTRADKQTGNPVENAKNTDELPRLIARFS